MITMQDEALSLAEQVRGKALTVVGGPYPSGEPETFVDQFDLVAVGEGEETIVSIMEHLDDRRFEEIPASFSSATARSSEHGPPAHQGHVAPAAALSGRCSERAVHRVLAQALEGRDHPTDVHARLPFPLRLLSQVRFRRSLQRRARWRVL
jgi:radical SAM superfamily enzyme YgiQ (UPF0313 family)